MALQFAMRSFGVYSCIREMKYNHILLALKKFFFQKKVQDDYFILHLPQKCSGDLQFAFKQNV